MIKCKGDVEFGGFTLGLVKILETITRYSDRNNLNLLITSGSEGTHMKGSRHYSFEAVDVRSNFYITSTKHKIQVELQQALGNQFTVLLENEGQANEHFHIQVRLGHHYTEITNDLGAINTTLNDVSVVNSNSSKVGNT